MSTSSVMQQWEEWIGQSLLLGKSADELIQTMVENHFDRETAVQMLNAHMNRRNVTYSNLVPLSLQVPAGMSKVIEMDKPKLAIIQGFMSSEECAGMIELSQPRLDRSLATEKLTGNSVVDDVRTSSGMFFERGENPLIGMIENRIQKVFQYPIENGEGFQVLRYNPGQEYKPHYDYFEEEYTGSAPHLLRGGQRKATIIIYLNEVEAGGETIFPKINLKTFPLKGSALLFEYCDDGNNLDPLSLHGGCPVLTGEKWIAVKWIRQGKFE